MKCIPLYKDTPLAAVESVGPLQVDSDCSLCKMCEKTRNVCMRAEGDPGGILIVGDSPSTQEDRIGIPFSGPVGKFVRNTVAKLHSGPVAYDNALRCAPGSRQATDKHIDACRGYLASTLREVAPNRVIVLGGKAIKSVLGRSVPIQSARGGYGWLYNEDIDGTCNPIPVFEFISPVAATKNRFLRQWFIKDLERALTCKIPTEPPWEEDLYVVEDAADAVYACEQLRRGQWFAFDTETYGMMYQPDFNVVTLAACARGSNEVFVWDHAALKNKAVIAPLLDILSDPSARKVGQNLKYDAHAVDFGLKAKLTNYHGDSRLWRRLLYADVDARLDTLAELVGLGGIKEEAARSLNVTVKRIQKARRLYIKDPLEFLRSKDGGNPVLLAACKNMDAHAKTYAYGMLPWEVLVRYCARDTLTTVRVGEHLEERLSNNKPVKRIWDLIVKDANSAIKQIECWGLPTSVDNAKLFQGTLESKMDEINERFHGYPGLNPNSPKSVSNLLFMELGLHPPKMTATGGASTDSESLNALKGSHPVVDDLLEWRRLTKLHGFAKGIQRYICADGRIHPSIKIDGTRTGRLSCAEPNLQNIARPKDIESKMARDLFVAHDGHLFVEADFCLAPGTRVLTADLSWQPIEAIKVGDALVGFDEDVSPANIDNNCFRKATVENTLVRRAEIYRVSTSKGVVRASADHMWVVLRDGLQWIKTKDLINGDQILYFGAPWEFCNSWDGGAIASAVDSRGHLHADYLTFDKPKLLDHDELCSHFKAAGISLESAAQAGRYTIRGRKALMSFLGQYQPKRLLKNSDKLWRDLPIMNFFLPTATVSTVTRHGINEVVSVRTSAKTLIAEGFMTHNSQLELRVATMLSQDPEMMKIWVSGVDYHQRTAELIATPAWGIKESDVTDEHRSASKQVNFGLLYGMAVTTLAKRIGVPVAVAQKIVDSILGKFSGLQRWIKSQVVLARRTGYVYTWWDGEKARRRPLIDVVDPDSKRRSNAENGAANTPVQGSASDFCLASIIEIIKWLHYDVVPAELVLTVHDSVLFHVEESAVDEVCHQAVRIMQSWPSAGVPLVADLKIGKSWGSLEKVK